MKILCISDPQFDYFWQQGEKQILGATIFYTKSFRQYDQLLFADKMIADDSFIVLSEGHAVLALVPLYVFKGEDYGLQYSYGADYLRGPIISGEAGKNFSDKISQFVFTKIEEIASKKKVLKHLIMMEPIELLEGRHYYNYYLEYGYVDDASIDCLVECDPGKESLWSNLRKSYKALINKAQRNYKILNVDAQNFDFNLCEEYRNLHKLAAGRITRPLETFHHMYEMINEGKAFLVLVHDSSARTVGAYYFLIHGLYGFYGSGATDPLLDSQSGVGHLGLWAGILVSREKGCKYLDLGQLLIRPGLSEKEKNIFHFKIGFGGKKIVTFRGVKNFLER